jgi:MFS family permease
MVLQALGYLLVALSQTVSQAAGARIVEGIGAAIYTTISLSIVGELLSASPTRGRQMGVYRGMGSIGYAVAALASGVLADRAGIQASLLAAAALSAVGAAFALALQRGPHPRPILTTPLQAVVSSGNPQDAATTRSALPRLFLVGVLLLMAALAASSSMFPLYLNALGRSRTAIGSLWSLTAILEFPAMLFTGILSDTVGRAPLLAAGAVAIALVQLFYIGGARFSFSVVLGQITRSFGFASFTANAMSYTADLSSDTNRAASSGLFTLTQNTGQLVGLLLGGVLAQWFGFGALFGACALASGGAALAFFRLHHLRQRGPENE